MFLIRILSPTVLHFSKEKLIFTILFRGRFQSFFYTEFLFIKNCTNTVVERTCVSICSKFLGKV